MVFNGELVTLQYVAHALMLKHHKELMDINNVDHRAVLIWVVEDLYKKKKKEYDKIRNGE